MIAEAIAPARSDGLQGGRDASSAAASQGGSQLSIGKRIQQALMTGVSYMIPFVAAGGLLIASACSAASTSRSRPVPPVPRTCADLASWVDAETQPRRLDRFAGHLGRVASGSNYLGACCSPSVAARLSAAGPVGLHRLRAGRSSGHRSGFVGGVVAGAVGAGFLGAPP